MLSEVEESEFGIAQPSYTIWGFELEAEIALVSIDPATHPPAKV